MRPLRLILRCRLVPEVRLLLRCHLHLEDIDWSTQKRPRMTIVNASNITENNAAIETNTFLKLIEDFKRSGRNITCNNFFTNLDPAMRSMKDNLRVVGTLRRNKTFLPETFQSKDICPRISFYVLETVLISRALNSYQNKKGKNVFLLNMVRNKWKA
ncbi:PiggyBac transposable element-derived protein 4 [Plakobranchus ocellatus]|uniref:PiggyBac transposable element-derived protein 4 n=1 Tax=Plakobranchus ocellatus TaxID=259542 RepID=A0AAV4E1C3_9GAST|nr:PiggyBac transposable element-derived protein 4 [Plakobranchus ocellatus]